MLHSLYWLTQTLADVPRQDDWLTPAERACLAKLRFPKRRAEWRLGRWTAKCLLAGYFEIDVRSRPLQAESLQKRFPPRTTEDAEIRRKGMFFGESRWFRRSSADKLFPVWLSRLGEVRVEDFTAIEIRAAADGAPEAFGQNQPVPITLSISHRDDLGFCVINPSNLTIGCDLERLESRSDNFVEDYFTAEEKELIAHAPEKDHHWLATLIWSAKESALKALRQGLRLDTRSVVVNVTQASSLQFPWTPHQECHSGRIFFEFKTIAGNEKDSSGMTKWFIDAGNEQDFPTGAASGMTKWFTEHLRPTEWNPLIVRYTETAQTFCGWWRQTDQYIQTIIADLRAKSVENPT